MADLHAYRNFRKDDTQIIALRQSESADDPLTKIALNGARRTLAAAI